MPPFLFNILIRIYKRLPLPRRAQHALKTVYFFLKKKRNTHAHALQRLTFRGNRYHNPFITTMRSGVNLIGFIHGKSGFGEHIRLTAKSLEACHVPFTAKNSDTLFHGHNDDTTYTAALDDHAPHAVNLLCYNPPQILLLNDLEPSVLKGRYNIGYGYWELSEYPDAWLPSMNLVHEIWAPTRFIQHALAEKASVPVVYMPIPVTFDAPPQLDRKDFGLPETPFLFLFTFDLSSSMMRKNPMGAIRAFQNAFAEHHAHMVGLVIKVVMPEKPDAAALREWNTMMEHTAKDHRIIIINQVMEKSTLLSLIQTCDAYVSLHRAEGFGLGMAEAMCLGKPVIATGYSGNMDFTHEDTACLVGYTLVPVPHGAYTYADGMHWAEPNLDEASMWMHRLYTDASFARSLGVRAKDYMKHYYSAAYTGARMRKRLMLIGGMEATH